MSRIHERSQEFKFRGVSRELLTFPATQWQGSISWLMFQRSLKWTFSVGLQSLLGYPRHASQKTFGLGDWFLELRRDSQLSNDVHKEDGGTDLACGNFQQFTAEQHDSMVGGGSSLSLLSTVIAGSRCRNKWGDPSPPMGRAVHAGPPSAVWTTIV